MQTQLEKLKEALSGHAFENEQEVDTVIRGLEELSKLAREARRDCRRKHHAARRAADTSERDVHTEHCCAEHGCKYSDKTCTVVSRQKVQSFLWDIGDGCCADQDERERFGEDS